jgi:DnaJ-class molecular chaperone
MTGVCFWCEGRGRVERYVRRLRRRALVACGHCAGTGHLNEAAPSGPNPTQGASR